MLMSYLEAIKMETKYVYCPAILKTREEITNYMGALPDDIVCFEELENGTRIMVRI